MAGSVEPSAIAAAVAVLRAGGVVLHPTEAVWGLACAPLDASAVAALHEIKRRPPDKGLILVADQFHRFAPLLAPVPASRLRAALATWPGPQTWVFPAADTCPAWLTGGRRSLAIRVSAHPLVRALAEGFQGPLVSTSANTSGRPPVHTLAAVEPAIVAAVSAVVAGSTGGQARPTPIRDLLTGDLLRD